VGTASIDSQPSSRRSGRKRKSTTVTIDGFTIKTQNLYSVTADSYVYGGFQADAPKAKKAWTKPEIKPRGVKKTYSEPEQKRMEFNNGVKARVEQNAHLRKAFFASHVETFSPFLEESVDSDLRQFAKNNSSLVKAAKEMNTETFIQPDLIQAEMRDYQLIGLNWMVKMHKQNLACILGDEMGLVSFDFLRYIKCDTIVCVMILLLIQCVFCSYFVENVGQNIADNFTTLSFERDGKDFRA
jgi:hypothetical protein